MVKNYISAKDARTQTETTTKPLNVLFKQIKESAECLMICFNLFGNGLRDAFNPSLRGVEE